MRVDVEESNYTEAPGANQEFSSDELRHCRLLLRRLRFLETQIKQQGGIGASNNSGGGAFAEWELAALEWLLTEVGFLEEAA